MSDYTVGYSKQSWSATTHTENNSYKLVLDYIGGRDQDGEQESQNKSLSQMGKLYCHC